MTAKCITANGSSESVKFASISSPDPVSLHENVDSDGRTHGGHHDKIRKGQVDDKHVGLRKQGTVKNRTKRIPKRREALIISDIFKGHECRFAALKRGCCYCQRR